MLFIIFFFKEGKKERREKEIGRTSRKKKDLITICVKEASKSFPKPSPDEPAKKQQSQIAR